MAQRYLDSRRRITSYTIRSRRHHRFQSVRYPACFLFGHRLTNSGGRQLDGAIATLDALPDIVDVVKGKIPVHVDGGIRKGTDIFKALALGADFVWIGRPVLWGLAYRGAEGAELVLQILYDELRLAMALYASLPFSIIELLMARAGCASIQEINKTFLAKVTRDGFISRL